MLVFLSCLVLSLRKVLMAHQVRWSFYIYSALLKRHLECCVMFRAPLYKRDLDILDRIQHKITKMIGTLFCKDKLKELGLFSLEKRRLREDVINTFENIKGEFKEDGTRLFSVITSGRTRGMGTNRSTRDSTWATGSTSVLCRLSTGRGCPERL